MINAIVLSDYGPPQVLIPGEVEVGAPGAGQIRVLENQRLRSKVLLSV
jgi:hypothetical protein